MKKDDLISRKVLLDEFHSLCGPQTGDGWDNMGVRNLIMRQKAVDAAPVVRCKDCMYFRPWRHDRGDDSRCEFWNTEMGAEDYCSQAIYLNNGRNDDGKDA